MTPRLPQFSKVNNDGEKIHVAFIHICKSTKRDPDRALPVECPLRAIPGLRLLGISKLANALSDPGQQRELPGFIQRFPNAKYGSVIFK
jgi:hypothetical protein